MGSFCASNNGNIAIWSKMIPSNTEIERGSRFHDDGRELDSIMDEFEKSLKREAAEGGGAVWARR